MIDGTDHSSPYQIEWTAYSDDEFGDEDGSENHATGIPRYFIIISLGLATYSLQKLLHVYPIQESLTLINKVSQLLKEPTIGRLRTGLVVISIFYEVLGPEMQAMTSQVR